MLISAGVIALFASAAFPPKESTRNNIVFFSVGVLAVVFLMAKFSSLFFTCQFAETGMKVTDCGCFGDFIKLKPWETFYKDCVLDIIILVLVLNAKNIRPAFSSGINNVFVGLMGVGSLAFCLYNVYLNEPVIDFRPYAIGNDIIDLRKEKKPAKIDMVFVYKSTKTGEVKEFTYDDMMKGRIDYTKFDTMVERKEHVLDPGIPAKITNLRIENDEGADITDTILQYPGYSLMVVSFDLNLTHEAAFKQLNEIASGCDKAGVKFFAAVSNDGHVDEFRHKNQTPYPYYYADATPLKTIIRSNPGLLLLKHGVVINKWHYRHLPTFERLNAEYFSK